MRRIIRIALLLGFLANTANASKTKVLATTSFLFDITSNITKGVNEAESLLPVGTDPHLYEPVPGDATKIADAVVLIKNGLHLEGWLDKVIENSGTKAHIITATEGIDIIRSEQFINSVDPHAWMDPLNGILYAQNIYEGLAEVFPENKQAYEANFNVYKNTLLALHKRIEIGLSEIPEEKRIIITTHDAFSYFANRYGFRVESAMGVSTDADVRIEDLQHLISTIQQHDIPAIFVESTVNDKLFRQVSKDLKVKIGGKLFADSLDEPGKPAGTFVGMLEHNYTSIARGLLGKAHDHKAENKNILLLFVIIMTLILIAALVWVIAKLRKVKTDTTIHSENAIEVTGLSVSYDKKTVLNSLNLSIPVGKIVGIIGPNGAGKSTLFKSILGLIDNDAGTIHINCPESKSVAQTIAYIPQKEDVDWAFPATVFDLVAMGRYPYKQVFDKITALDQGIIDKAMQLCDISDLKKRQIGELSGGQQQRVFIARALAQEADIYFLDEPFVGVDNTTEKKIMGILKNLVEEGKSVLVIHHDLSEVEEYFDEVLLLNSRLIAFGPVKDVFTDANIKLCYSGQSSIFLEAEEFLHD